MDTDTDTDTDTFYYYNNVITDNTTMTSTSKTSSSSSQDTDADNDTASTFEFGQQKLNHFVFRDPVFVSPERLYTIVSFSCIVIKVHYDCHV